MPGLNHDFIVWRDGLAIPEALLGSVVAIGNFDGVHQGHLALIKAVQEEAQKQGKAASIITFEPHPRQFFQPEKRFFRLTAETVKLSILAKLQLDGVFLKTFNASFAQVTANTFMNWLFDDLKISGLAVGHDFHFGANRLGTSALIANACHIRGIRFIPVPPVSEGDMVVSSSAIRQALQDGAIDRANSLLGYRWFVRSEVEHGEKRGRQLGFPTANMQLDASCPLRFGVYAVRARFGNQYIEGVASFGRRPTFDDGLPRLEVFLFDFSGNLYGQNLDIEFVAFIRPEKRFNDISHLITAMNKDCDLARIALKLDQMPSMIEMAAT